jgi:hypothetical protein
VDARPEPLDRIFGPLCVRAGLIADRLELGDSLLQHRVGEIGDAVLNRVVEPPLTMRGAVSAGLRV